MAMTYSRITIGSAGGSGDDRRVKVSGDDGFPGYLEEKVESGSTKLLVSSSNPGANEKLVIDVDQAQIDHDQLLNYEADEHAPLDDASTSTTSLWSSDKTQNELDGKVNAATPIADNTLIKSVGTSGVDIEATGITVDDSDNVQGINNLTINGDLTVNGTTTSVNSTTLETTDANITVNNGGTQASADTQDAGITVEMSDATDAALGFDSSLSSKFALGEVGDLREVLTSSHTQNVLNKSIDADNNTISNLETDNLKAGVITTDLDTVVDDTNVPSSLAVQTYVADQLATQDEASEISYDNSTSGLTAINTQTAIDEVEGRLDTAETSLSNHLDAGTGKHGANQINYDGSAGLIANNVEDALDELDTEKYNAADFNGDFDTRLATKDTGDVSEGANLYFTDERAQDAVGNILGDTVVTLTYDDVTPSITANLDVTGRSSLTSATIANGDEFLVYDLDASDYKKITYSELVSQGGNLSVGDKKEAEASLADNTASATATGISFSNAVVRSFRLQVSIERAGGFETVDINGIQKASDWDITIVRLGDDTGINFDINASGQITYTSTSTGNGATVQYRADTTSA